MNKESYEQLMSAYQSTIDAFQNLKKNGKTETDLQPVLAQLEAGLTIMSAGVDSIDQDQFNEAFNHLGNVLDKLDDITNQKEMLIQHENLAQFAEAAGIAEKVGPSDFEQPLDFEAIDARHQKRSEEQKPEIYEIVDNTSEQPSVRELSAIAKDAAKQATQMNTPAQSDNIAEIEAKREERNQAALKAVADPTSALL